ncbi:MAG: hypothetical protein FD167_240 [bacterium]|nr:MAG: hypothetical protein FD167_240 [bacterium]
MIFELGLQKYEDIDESLKNLASIRHCGAQVYLIAGDVNAAMEEISIAAKLSEYKDPQIMKTFLSLLNNFFAMLKIKKNYYMLWLVF